jgi:hypothetical protein
MNDEQLREAYERGLPANDMSPTLDDVSAERLRRLVEGEGSESERLRTLDLALSSVEGRRELEMAWAAARAARPRRGSWRRVAIAASVLVVAGSFALWVRARNTDENDVLRGLDSPVHLVAPVGVVTARQTTRFIWRPVANVVAYTIVVVDTTGTELFAQQTRDTALVLPDSVRLAPGHAYLWWVQARLADETTLTAVTQRLIVTDR